MLVHWAYSNNPRCRSVTSIRNVSCAFVLLVATALDGAAQTATPAPAAPAPAPAPAPFAEQFNTLANGTEARNVSFASANPTNYEDIVARRPMPSVTLEAKLYAAGAGITRRRQTAARRACRMAVVRVSVQRAANRAHGRALRPCRFR
jgi:hypothetical protein